MSGVSVVPYSLAPMREASIKPTKKRKIRTISTDKNSSMVDASWTKVDMEGMQLNGFQDGCAFELEELTNYHVEMTEGGGKILVEDSQVREEQSRGNKKKRRKSKTVKKQQLETETNVDVDSVAMEVPVKQEATKLNDNKLENGENASKKGKKKKEMWE
ncbi:unnamed protein product [Peronospora belbahrii]|uniref:Uncharacterized protein n=1 Tax=Peronospora belbahrii TaxID=622444 RepID=A0AAU9KX28_9STRA|nr:unnamed protein product [Peronospora belbahrii]